MSLATKAFPSRAASASYKNAQLMRPAAVKNQIPNIETEDRKEQVVGVVDVAHGYWQSTDSRFPTLAASKGSPSCSGKGRLGCQSISMVRRGRRSPATGSRSRTRCLQREDPNLWPIFRVSPGLSRPGTSTSAACALSSGEAVRTQRISETPRPSKILARAPSSPSDAGTQTQSRTQT